jgi:hypothetical protein
MKMFLALPLLIALLGCERSQSKAERAAEKTSEQQEMKKTLLEVEAQRQRNEIDRDNANRMIEYEKERQRERRR